MFLAPTRPLVEQQADACHLKMGIPYIDSIALTGSTKKDDDGKRSSIWQSKRVIYATPQTIANDIKNVRPFLSSELEIPHGIEPLIEALVHTYCIR